ncbi:mucin-22-like, partial [Mytilus californianus]|uniref:mucin-22-like n=1 Tax=Mytilus californianus TaxID=6549 RepID=UPI0022469A04
LGITTTNDTTTASTAETTTAALTTFTIATTTALTQLTTTSHTTTSLDKPTAISTEVTTTSPTTTSPDAPTTASTQVTTTSPTTIYPDSTTTASTQVKTTSHTTSSPNATTTASTQVTTTSPTTTPPDATTTASIQVTSTSPTTTFPDKTTTASTQVTTASFIPTSPDDTTTASTPDTTTLPITTSTDETTTMSTQVTTTSALTTSPDKTTAASTQENTTSALITSPYITTMASTLETTTSALITSPDETTTASTVETTTSALTTSPDKITMPFTVETTPSALTTSPEETTIASTVETTTSALTTSPEETTMASTVETTTSALTSFPYETTTTSTQETTTSASTTSPDETTTASSQKTTRSALITSPYITTMASTLETTTSALTSSPNETTMASTVETTTSPLTTSPEETTMASTVETTTSPLTTSPEETTMASTVGTTISALTTSPEKTTMAPTMETTTLALTTSPEETTMASTVETTTSALTTFPDETTTASTQETTTSALTTSPEETTMASTVETTTSALTTFSDETTTASTQETTTSALTTFPDETTTASTQETTTSFITTSPDETTMVSTQETTTSANCTSPDETTMVTTQETTTSANCTSPDETTMVSTQETTTSANCTSPDITTTHKLNTKTTKQLTTSSPLKITMTTRVATAYCPEEIFNNIIWSQIVAGQKDTQQCPPGYTGNVFRKCNDNGDWEAPVYIECVNMALYETSEKLNDLENNTDPEEATEVIDDVLNIINNNTIGNENPPTSGDLKHTTNILSQIVGLGASKNATVDSEKFGDVLNSVLDTDNSGSWNEVNSEEQSEEGASKIMGIVESLGSLVQKNLLPNETKIINKTNLVIEVSTMKKNLTFPPDSNSMSKLNLADQLSLQDTLYTAALYRTLSGILPTTPNRSVGSDVISVSFGQDIDILTENITIRFEQNKKVPFTDPKISCGYWNFSARSWTYDGCYLKMTDSRVSTCTCNHLTNFAILMSPSDVEISDANQKALEIITFVGCGLSILGCFLTLIIYTVFWRSVKNEWAVILMNMCIVLIIGYSVFLSATEETENDIACIIITAVLHYVFLVVFFLMLCEGVSVATAVTVVFKTKSRLPIYLSLAWVVPLVIVGTTLGVTRLKGYHSNKYCWLNTSNFVFMAFVGPALLIILMNIGTIILVLRAMYSSVTMANERLKKKARAGLKCMVTLLPVLGLSWLFGILAFNEDTIIFQYLFGITTSCQGLFIFIFHTVLNKKVQEGFRKIMHRRRAKSMSNFSSKPKSSGTHDRFDSKVSNTDTTKLKDMKTETPKKHELRAFLKINKSQAYEVAKA